MASPQCSTSAVAPTAAPVAVVRPVPARTASARSSAPGGRVPSSVAPAAGRRDPVRPGGRPARGEGVTAARPVRGGCAPEPVARPGAGRSTTRDPERVPAPLRLTRRGRRVVAGLSVAIGLSIAAGTVVTIELGGADGGLRLAGASTVVVEPGDTLWDIARSVAPDEDARAVVDAIVELNGLDSVDLMPGAELQLP
jgi:nucleoid-associated protein YgaU